MNSTWTTLAIVLATGLANGVALPVVVSLVPT